MSILDVASSNNLTWRQRRPGDREAVQSGHRPRKFDTRLQQKWPFQAHLKIADRKGRILIDWLRNGMGATAVSSYCPRARAGATVATPLAWDEVKAGLDPAAFTVLTIPDRLKRLRKNPWKGVADLKQQLPQAETPRPRSVGN
jgi:DNA primase